MRSFARSFDLAFIQVLDMLHEKGLKLLGDKDAEAAVEKQAAVVV